MGFGIDRLANLLTSDRRGVTAVEYAIIAGVVALVIVFAFTSLGNSITGQIFNVSFSI